MIQSDRHRRTGAGNDARSDPVRGNGAMQAASSDLQPMFVQRSSSAGLPLRLTSLLAEARVAVRADPGSADYWLACAQALLPRSEDATSPRADRDQQTGGLAHWQITRVKRHIDMNLAERVTTAELAGLTRLSTGHFARAFKSSVGCSPRAYLIRRRLELARRLLVESDLALSHIALEAGMADQAHLSRLFRQFFATTPSTWRRQHRCPDDL